MNFNIWCLNVHAQVYDLWTMSSKMIETCFQTFLKHACIKIHVKHLQRPGNPSWLVLVVFSESQALLDLFSNNIYDETLWIQDEQEINNFGSSFSSSWAKFKGCFVSFLDVPSVIIMFNKFHMFAFLLHLQNSFTRLGNELLSEFSTLIFIWSHFIVVTIVSKQSWSKKYRSCMNKESWKCFFGVSWTNKKSNHANFTNQILTVSWTKKESMKYLLFHFQALKEKKQ